MNDSAVSLTPSSEASSRIYRLILNVYVVGALCLVGISGNLVSIVVLGRDRSIRRTTGLLLRALAVTDTVYLVSCLFIQTAKTICDSTDWVHPTVCRALPYLEPYMWPLASIAQTGNVWMLVVITADRYVAICRPLHAAQYSTVSRARTAVIVCWSLAVVYNLPRFFERVTEFRSTSNDTEPTVARTALRDNHIYVVVYKSGLFFVARFLVPFSTIAFFNTRLIMAIRASARLQADGRSSGEMRRREKYTLTLVIVVLVFVICELPDLFLRTWMALRSIAPAIPYPTSELRLVNVVSNLFLTINSSVNFIIYCVVGRRFRDVLVRVICSSESRASRLRRYAAWPTDTRGQPRISEIALRHLERSGAENSQVTVRAV